MSTSKDPDHFFQSTHSLAESERKSLKSKNKNGSPVRLRSKILAVTADPSCPGNAIFVATSGGNVIRVMTDEKDATYKGPTTPVTCIAISPDGQKLFAGCWDKTIWSWSVADRRQLLRYRGHTDFVKCVVTVRLSLNDVIVSGGADASIVVWDVKTGKRIHVLKGHTRGVLGLAIDPLTYDTDDNLKDASKDVTIFSAGSDREIRRWRIGLDKAEQLDAEQPILAHETSVYALRFDADGDLWTASADGTTKCLSRSHEFQPDATIKHGDYVRAVAIDEIGGRIVTAGRSEDIKIWDRGSGNLVHVFDGHFDEVSGLVLFEQRCVSVGIDCTVRTWSLKTEDMQNARRKQEVDQQRRIAGEDVVDDQHTKTVAQGGLTEEEEQELAELMQNDE
ncbi:MAG: hypothetical protein Q9184_001634 [Pyrenodesmia sp. 2 TL-2023]